jgi:hypothetical protein
MDSQLLVSLHQGHINKTKENFAAVEASCPWSAEQLPVDALLDHVLAGNAWVACQLIGGKRNEASARESNLIVLDIDGDLDLETFWANSFAARHCLLTYTSCSHNPDGEHRFRALFRCEVHEGADLHRAIYQQVVDALGFVPKDSSGAKPERLWYGNTNAEVRFGAGVPLSWDLVERAREELSAELERRNAPQSELVDDGLKFERIAWVLANLLRPSEEGQYEQWASVLNCAAASGSEPIKQAFFIWHEKGFHGTGKPGKPAQRMNSRRYDSAGKKAEPGHILKLIKQQEGEGWWRQLPEHLWFGGGESSVKPPTILMRARSADDIAPAGGTLSFSQGPAAAVPSVVPSPVELEKLAARASIMQTSAKTAAAKTSEPAELTLDQKLRRLYYLRAHDVLPTGDDLQQVLPHEFASLDRELLGDLLTHPGYCRQPAEVERDLLTIFRQEHSFSFNPRARVKRFILDGRSSQGVTWLIPNFLLAGGEHILYSKGGVGKTILAIHMARALSGDPEIGQFLDSGSFSNHHIWQRNRIVFIGSDMESRAEKQTDAYLKSMHAEGKPFLKQVEWFFEDQDAGTPAWKLCLKDLTQLYELLESEHSKGTPVAAVFIDSMKAVCPDHILVGQQGFKDYVKLVKDICFKFEAALIWIHHERADGNGAQGIQRITEGSDANFHFKKDEKTNQYTLEIEKIRGGAKSRTITFNPFAPGGPKLANQAAFNSDDDNTSVETMVIAVLTEDFTRHRLHTSGSSQWVERSYLGMKISEIEAAIQERFRPRAASLHRKTLQRRLAKLVETERLTATGTGIYRLAPLFRPKLVEQPGLDLHEASADVDVPGWS